MSVMLAASTLVSPGMAQDAVVGDTIQRVHGSVVISYVRISRDSIISDGYLRLDSLAMEFVPTEADSKRARSTDTLLVDEMPTLSHEVPPVYPMKALLENKEATVWMRALVDTLGLVRAAYVLKASKNADRYGFIDEVLLRAIEMSYSPATAASRPIPLWVTYPVEFKLR